MYANRVNVVHFSKDEYGAFSKNWSVDISNDGNIYFGNDAGLLSFDGAKWQLYEMPNQGIVRCVKIIQDSLICVGSYEEFGYFKKDSYGQLNYYSLSDSIKAYSFDNNEFWKIEEDTNGSIYFQSFSEVFKYSEQSIQQIHHKHPLLFLLKARERFLGKTFNNEFVELIDDQFVPIKHGFFERGEPLRMVLPIGEKDFLLGTSKGLVYWDTKTFKRWGTEIQEEIKDKNINAGYFDGQYFYIATLEGGIYVIDHNGSLIQHLSTANYLETNTIYDVRLDKNKRLWYTSNKGIGYIELSFPLSFILNDKINIGMVHDIAFYQDHIYLGTNTGIYRTPSSEKTISNIQLSNFKQLEGSDGQTWNLKVVDGQLLCGHNMGSFRIEGETLIRISDFNGGQIFTEINKGDHTFLLESTYNELVKYRKDGSGKWVFDQMLKGFSDGVNRLESDHYGNIWSSHFIRNNIYKFRLKGTDLDSVVVSNYGVQQGLPTDNGNRVYTINNHISFSTSNGFYAYDHLKDTIVVHSELNAQLGEFAQSKKVFSNGNDYWFVIGSKVGLFTIENDDFKKRFEYNFQAPGISLVERYENILPLNNHQAIICLENGIALFNSSNIEGVQSSIDYPIYFQKVFFTDKHGKSQLLSLEDVECVVPHNTQSIRLEFSSLKSPGKNLRYQYKLNGYDTEWSQLSHPNFAEYKNLKHGNYQFVVIAEDEFGNQLEAAQFAFVISTPWYLTTYAMVVFGLLWIIFFASIPYGVRLYVQYHKSKVKEQHARDLREKQLEERLKSEKEIMKLRNDNLRDKVEHQSSQLASSTLGIIRKNESLLLIKDEVEKKRKQIAGRLHDGFLDSVLKLIDRNIEHQSDWEYFQNHFDNAHENFTHRLKDIYPNLTPKDLRLCAYLKMNLSSKEIAPLLNINIRSVEVHRYRIRKKLNLESEDNLVEFMMGF